MLDDEHVPHPVSWTHGYATRLDAARVPRARRAARDTPDYRGVPAPIVAFDDPVGFRRFVHRREGPRYHDTCAAARSWTLMFTSKYAFDN